MKTVLISVGHKNIRNLTSEGLRSWRDPSKLHGSTGASGELDYFWNEVAPRLKSKLIGAGINASIVDAVYHRDVYDKSYNLFVSMHYDGGGTQDRCMISSPRRNIVPPYLNETAYNESDRFCTIWKNIYPQLVGTINRDERITPGMWDYYMFDYVNEDTPSVIIEHFNHTGTNDQKLKNDPDKVAEGDFQSIIRFLDVPLDKCYNLDIDIPTEVEEDHKLKLQPRYNKKWSFNDLMSDWVELAKIEDTFQKRLSEMSSKLVLRDQMIQTLTGEITRLKGLLEIEQDMVKKQKTHITSLTGTIAEKDNQLSSLLSKHTKLNTKYEECLSRNFDKMIEEITRKEKFNYIIKLIRSL
jgi:hypothetical protein